MSRHAPVLGIVTTFVVVACGARTGLFETDIDPNDPEGEPGIVDGGRRRPDAAVSCDDGGSGTRCREANGTLMCVDTQSDPEHCGGCATRCGVVEACASSECVPIASQFTGLRWELPCLAPGSEKSCSTPGLTIKTATIGGQPGVTYDVRMRFRGVVETEGYSGGSNDGAYFQIGGAPIEDGWNIYKLEISAPPQTYFLNRGKGGLRYCFPIDYSATVQMAGGATVTMTADPVDGATEEIVNVGQNGKPIVIDGIPPAPKAFDGQFIQVDVTSVQAR